MVQACTIALDFDNTWSVDPQLWRQFVSLAESSGHKIVAVSGRDDTEEHRLALRAEYPPSVEIVLCNHRPKRAVMAERGMRIDIWIDDYPEGIPVECAGKS